MADSFVMCIGPLEGERGTFFEYIVFPGREGCLQYFAAADDEAFEQILHDYEAAELSCEERLAKAGARYGIEAHPLSDPARHGLSLFAVDRFPERPFSSLTEVSRLGLTDPAQLGQADPVIASATPSANTMRSAEVVDRPSGSECRLVLFMS